jgi:hypothetical protein
MYLVKNVNKYYTWSQHTRGHSDPQAIARPKATVAVNMSLGTICRPHHGRGLLRIKTEN